MRRIVRRLLAGDQAQETRVFVLMAAFGVAVGAVYWFVSYEPAGTAMLVAFGLATGVIGFRLARDPASRAIRRRLDDAGPRREDQVPDDAADVAGGGTAGIDRPFSDETGRLPDATIAPFAVGLGAAVAATGLVFGPAPVIVGLLPFVWGAWAWLGAAGEELRAADHEAPPD
jgi:Cytochrome c oxidase subunit IV